MSEWTREHDAVIARECEGKTVYTWDDLMPIYANTNEPSWPNRSGLELHRKRIPDELFHMKHPSCTIPHYSIDLAACVQAAEAWRKKGKDNQWIVESPTTGDTELFEAIVWGPYGQDGLEHGPTFAAALSAALCQACGGIK